MHFLQNKKLHSRIKNQQQFHLIKKPCEMFAGLFRRYTVLDAILPWKRIELNNQITLIKIAVR